MGKESQNKRLQQVEREKQKSAIAAILAKKEKTLSQIISNLSTIESQYTRLVSKEKSRNIFTNYTEI